MDITSRDDSFVSVVIYVRNSAVEAENFTISINEILQKYFKFYEIIFVDDAGTDLLADRLKNVAAKNKISGLSILRMSFPQGRESSLAAGIDMAIGDFVFEFENPTIDYPTDLIMDAYRRSQNGFDLVSVAPKNSHFKSSGLFYRFFNRFSSISIDLKTETFRILSRRLINRSQGNSTAILYRKAAYAASGLRQSTIYYSSNTDYSETIKKHKDEFRQSLALDVLILYTDFAWKVTVLVSILMCIFSIFLTVYAMVIYFFGYNPVPGWTTTMLFMSASFCGVFAILAFIIKYLSVIISLIFKRKRYTAESLEKISGS